MNYAPFFKDRPCVYQGSVKNLYELKAPQEEVSGTYIFEFTDDYSIFDYGKMPDPILGKGCALTLMSAHIFERLGNPSSWQALDSSPIWEKIGDRVFRDFLKHSQTLKKFQLEGLSTHYQGVLDLQGRLVKIRELTSPSSAMQVAAVRILRPKREVKGELVSWDYSSIRLGMENYLIPLENIFRFGMPQGSSLIKRLTGDPAYAKTLGLSGNLSPGAWLPHPIVEFSSKLETTDRFMSADEAAQISGLKNGEFELLREGTFLIALFLMDCFQKVGVELWDGKIEFIKTDRLVMGDSVTPDELRLIKEGVQISKEPLRQYYKTHHPDFMVRLEEAKPIAAKTGRKIKEVLCQDFHYEPPRLDPSFKKIMEGVYQALAQELTGLELFPNIPSLSTVIAQLKNDF